MRPCFRSPPVLRIVAVTLALAAVQACGARWVEPFADGASPDVPRIDAGPPVDVRPFDTGPGDVGPQDRAPPPDVQPFRTATHEPFPTVPDQGGARIASPQVIVITYAEDPGARDDEAYVEWMMHSDWLTTVGREWGVTTGSVVGNIRLPQPAPVSVTNSEIERFLSRGVADHTLPQPASGLADAVYIVFYPEVTTITLDVLGQSSTSCAEFGGYHETFVTGGQTVAYAAIPTCASPPPGLTMLESIQVATSHELIEAATDAHPLADAAWALGPETTSGWIVFGGEVADLCVDVDWRDATHIATRVWSNTRAAAGLDPCVPTETSRPYFNVSTTPDEARAVMPGQTVTFPIIGWSSAPVSNWTVSAYAGIGNMMPSVRVTPGRMNNGVTGTVTVNIPADAPSGSYAGIVVYSERSSSDHHMYPLAVYVP